jgi:DinB superfamily
MLAANPYASYVGPQDPISLLETTPHRIAELVNGWNRSEWNKSYAPGKWSGAQVMLHLAHDEIGWCNRIRLAMTVPNYVVQPYDGADWVAMETPTDPETALATYLSLRRLNLMLYKRIPTDRRTRPFAHPEMGEISIDWILNMLAGHDLLHFQHLQTISSH